MVMVETNEVNPLDSQIKTVFVGTVLDSQICSYKPGHWADLHVRMHTGRSTLNVVWEVMKTSEL